MQLRDYLNSLPTDAQQQLAERCGTSVGYLRKAISIGQPLGESICVGLEQFSSAIVTCESLRPDITWVRVRDRSWPHKGGRPLVDHASAA